MKTNNKPSLSCCVHDYEDIELMAYLNRKKEENISDTPIGARTSYASSYIEQLYLGVFHNTVSKYAVRKLCFKVESKYVKPISRRDNTHDSTQKYKITPHFVL